jgi:hypothetical protein
MNTINEAGIAIGILSMVIVLVAFKNFRGKNDMKIPDQQGNAKGFAVVELFTSEGCSSCPPADELVARVQNDNPLNRVYILAYHVDYWDHQGWKDKFDDPEYSKRQTEYSCWFHLQSIYTPQIVVNGITEFVGSDRSALLQAITAGLKEVPADTLAIKAYQEKGQLSVGYQTNTPLEQSALVITLIQKSGQSIVRAGENAGLTLQHVQIVRKFLTKTLHATNGKISFVLPEDYKMNDWELIAFVQNKMTGSILTAAKAELVLNPAD